MRKGYGQCKFVEYTKSLGDPRFGLTFDGFEPSEPFFQDRDLEGSGYTWHGVVEALLRKHDPQFLDSLEFDPESSMFCVRSSSVEALDAVAKWINRALADPDTLENAIEDADPTIIE